MMFNLQGDTLEIILPQGHTMSELNTMAKAELSALIKEGQFFGKDIKINGKCTTAMAILLGHELAHVCKSVSIFDPKENTYVMCVQH